MVVMGQLDTPVMTIVRNNNISVQEAYRYLAKKPYNVFWKLALDLSCCRDVMETCHFRKMILKN